MRDSLLLSIVVLLVSAGCGGGVDEADERTAVAAAKAAYADAKAAGTDLTDGPCLGRVLPDWVADVAHDPRTDVDDDPANQCADYRSGEVDHFVELDPDGEVIRVE